MPLARCSCNERAASVSSMCGVPPRRPPSARADRESHRRNHQRQEKSRADAEVFRDGTVSGARIDRVRASDALLMHRRRWHLVCSFDVEGPMTRLDDLVPEPRLQELDSVLVRAPIDAVWQRVRHGELAQALPIRALFALRSLMMRDASGSASSVRIDELRSSPDRPGFQILADDPPREVALGAIGQVWRPRIPFVHVPGAHAYAAFDDRGFVKVAWAVRIVPLASTAGCRVEIEVRVSATDPASWRKFRWYFALIGPFSRYIRRSLLRTLARDGQWASARPQPRQGPPSAPLGPQEIASRERSARAS